MDFRDAWLGMPRAQRDQLAQRMGTSYKYLQKLAGGFGLPSLEFAQKMREVLPEVLGDSRVTLDMAGFVRAKQEAGARAKSS